jgi:hypothetical protein
MCGLTFTFDDAQQFGVGGQGRDELFGLAALVRLGEEIQAAIDHLHGDGCKRLIERFSHTVSEIHQNGIQQPGGPDFNLDSLLGATPKTGKAQQAFDDGVCILNPPALPIQGHPVGGGQAIDIQLIAQIPIPGAAIGHFDQSALETAGTWASMYVPFTW